MFRGHAVAGRSATWKRVARKKEQEDILQKDGIRKWQLEWLARSCLLLRLHACLSMSVHMHARLCTRA